MPGRKVDTINQFYTLVNGKERCKFCGKKYSHNIEHMTNHIQYLCVKATEEARNFATQIANCKSEKQKKRVDCKKKRTKSSRLGATPSTSSSGHSSTSTPSFLSPHPSRPASQMQQQNENEIQARIPKMFENLSERQANFKKDFAHAVYSTGYPLAMVEATEWQDFFKKYLPTLPLPNRHEMSGTLLDNSYREVKKEVDAKVAEAESVCVQLDGWSNIRKEAIMHVIATTPSPVLLESIASGVDRHTGQYMANKLTEVIEDIGPEKVIGGVTDGAAAMLKARDLLKKKFPHMEFFTCADHGLNNYLKDIATVQPIADIISRCNIITQEILKSPLLLAWFTELQANRNGTLSLKSPGTTRFGSQSFVLKSIVSNKSVLRQMVIEDHPTKPELRLSTSSHAAIVSNTFWDELEHLNNYFNLILKWITVLESDTPRCDLAVEAFYEAETGINQLLEKLQSMTSDHASMMHKNLKTRHAMVLTPLHYSANLLNPKLKGEHLTMEHHSAAFEFIEQYAQLQPQFTESNVSEVMVELSNFKASADYFAKQYVKSVASRVEPLAFWNGVCSCTKVSVVAKKILSMHPTSSATERSFSSAGHIHSKKRNRLTTDRAAKLTFIKHNVKLLKLHNKKEMLPQLVNPRVSLVDDGDSTEESDYYTDDDVSLCSIASGTSSNSQKSASVSLMSVDNDQSGASKERGIRVEEVGEGIIIPSDVEELLKAVEEENLI